MIPKRFVERLPFQAISCSLAGVKPLQGVWTEESIGFANACLKPSNEPQMTVLAESLEKRENTDPETKSPVYSIKLTIPGHQETNACDLATLLVASNYAITTYEETVQLQTSKVEREETAETSTISDEQSARTVYVDEIQEGEQEEENFYDMSPAWYDYIVSSMESRGSTDVQRDEDVKSEVDISRIDSLEEGNIEKENIEEDNREEKCEASDTTDEATSLETPCIVDLHGNDQRTADNQKVVEEILASAIQAITVDTPPCTLPFESDALKENREDSERTSTLIEHIVPLKTADSHFPSTIWYQNGEQVTVTFEIGEVDKYEIEFSPNCFSFAATVNEQR